MERTSATKNHYKIGLFFVAINEFNMGSSEFSSLGKKITQFDTAIHAFNQVIQMSNTLTSIVVFLNKSDIFLNHAKNPSFMSAFKKQFPKFGGDDGNSAMQYLAHYFQGIYSDLSENVNLSRQLPVHITCALDTDAMGVVFNTVRTNIFSATLGTSGFEM